MLSRSCRYIFAIIYSIIFFNCTPKQIPLVLIARIVFCSSFAECGTMLAHLKLIFAIPLTLMKLKRGQMKEMRSKEPGGQPSVPLS